MRKALRPQLHEKDWEQCTLFEKKFFPVEAFEKLGHGHISYEQLAEYLLPDLLDNYFKFAFVRNPYDRYVSTCYFLNRNNNSMDKRPVEMMKEIVKSDVLKTKMLYHPQYSFIVNKDHQLKTDFIGKFEKLDVDFQLLSEHLQFSYAKLNLRNHNAHPPYQELYDEELRELVYEYYKKDFTTFDYSVDI